MSCDPVADPEELVNPPKLRSDVTTSLIEDAGCATVRTDRREVDAVTAIRRGLKEYLGQLALDVEGSRVQLADVYDDWADAPDTAAYPAAAVLVSSDVAYDASGFTPKLDPRDVTPSGRYLIKYAEVTCEVKIEVYCTSAGERVGVAMLLEDGLNPVDFMHGFRLYLPFYWGSRATYSKLKVDVQDDAVSARHGLRRLSYTLEAQLAEMRPRELPTFNPKIALEVVEADQELSTDPTDT